MRTGPKCEKNGQNLTFKRLCNNLFCINYLFLLPDLFRITNLFCSNIALFCITWQTYFVPTADLICYKTVRRILARFQGYTK